jgi:PEP-CTERM motif
LRKFASKAVALAAISVAAGLGVTAARADTFTVYTGYADNLRPSGFFPTPWLGDPNVVSQTPTGQTLDAGALRIVNTGTTAITISNLSVTMNGGGGPVYNIWASLTIGVGQQGIFTQTASFNFDSSDNSTGSPPGGITGSDPGSNGIGGCSSTAAAQSAAGITGYCGGRQPIVSFDENGTSFTLNDTGHILDTGNYDFINGSPDGNESINWNLIGSEANRGGVPEPSTWAMMLLGFAGLGLVARRKARTSVLAA